MNPAFYLRHKMNPKFISSTVVGDNINIMETTFELNFYLYQAFKQHG